MKHKKLLISLGASLVLLLGIVTAASFYLVDYALVSAERERNSNLAQIEKRFPELKSWLDSLQTVGALRDTFVVMPTTGKRAHALFVRHVRMDAPPCLCMAIVTTPHVCCPSHASTIVSLGLTCCCPTSMRTDRATATQYRWDGRIASTCCTG